MMDANQMKDDGPQKRALSLFFDLQERYGSGIPYHQKIFNEPHAASVQRIQFDRERKSIALIRCSNLVKVFFFPDEFPHGKSITRHEWAFRITAGKLSPTPMETQPYFHEEMMICSSKEIAFSDSFSVNDVIAGLGMREDCLANKISHSKSTTLKLHLDLTL